MQKHGQSGVFGGLVLGVGVGVGVGVTEGVGLVVGEGDGEGSQHSKFLPNPLVEHLADIWNAQPWLSGLPH